METARSLLDRVEASELRTGGNRSEHRRPERRGLPGCGDREFPARDVREDLHQQLVLLRKPAARDHTVDRHACPCERIDDRPRPERSRLEQRPVHLLGPGREGQAEDDAG